MLWNILEIESVHIGIYLPAAAKLFYIKHSPLLTSNLVHCLHQMFFIVYIKSSPLSSTSNGSETFLSLQPQHQLSWSWRSWPAWRKILGFWWEILWWSDQPAKIEDDLDPADDGEPGEEPHGASDKTQLTLNLDLLVSLDVVEGRRVKVDLHQLEGWLWQFLSWDMVEFRLEIDDLNLP